MNHKKKMIAAGAAGAVMILTTAGSCDSDADVASRNLSKAADQFEVMRRIVFFNGITDKYLLEIVGYCSLGNDDPVRELSVTCKVDDGKFKKHFVGLSDNVSYLVEQIDPVDVSTTHYRVIFKPESIVPDFDRP
jgi:hypothetical protein